MTRTTLWIAALVALAGTCRVDAADPAAHAAHAAPSVLRPKVVIVTMFGPEAQAWLDHLGPWRDVRVDGLAPDYPVVHCNRDTVCVITTGMGHANAAASMMALAFSRRFDLRQSYFLVAGIAGINPQIGTLGSVAWARYLVDFGIQWEIDAREIPAGWHDGYLGINTQSAQDKPALDYRTELFRLDERLLQKSYALSHGVALADSADAQAARQKFTEAPAQLPPAVLQCDTLAGDTWFSGTALGERASEWMRLLTDGAGVYCTTQQEDNATYEALKRAAAAGRVDLARVAVLRAGSDFDRPHPGQSSADNLLNYQSQGGFGIALDNLYRAGEPLVRAITHDWAAWRHGTPSD